MAADGPRGPHNLRIVESCLGCTLREEGIFCQLPHAALSTLNSLRLTSFYPKGVLLFVEGQPAQGLYIMCSGEAKLYVNSAEGQSLTVRIVEHGEVLGLSSLMADEAYPVTAETLSASQVSFIPRLEFLQFMRANPDVAIRVAKHLSMEWARRGSRRGCSPSRRIPTRSSPSSSCSGRRSTGSSHLMACALRFS